MKLGWLVIAAPAVALVVLSACSTSDPATTGPPRPTPLEEYLASNPPAESTIATTTAAPTTTTPPTTTAATTTTLSPKELAEAEVVERLFTYREAYYRCTSDPEACDAPQIVDEFTASDDEFDRPTFISGWQKLLADGEVELTDGEPKVTLGWVRVADSLETATTFHCTTVNVYIAPRAVLSAPETTIPDNADPEYLMKVTHWELFEGRWVTTGGEAGFGLEPGVVQAGAIPSVSQEEIDACFAK